MELATIKEKIHSLIDTTSEDKLLEIYHILDSEEDYTEGDYSDEFKAELDAEYEDYQKNKDVVSKEEFYLFTEQLLQRHKNNVL